MRSLRAVIRSLASQARESECGQTMAEYAIVLAMITVAIVATLGLLGGGINSASSSVTSSL